MNLPTCEKYAEYLRAASRKFGITMNEARDKFGLLTNLEWAHLLEIEVTK